MQDIHSHLRTIKRPRLLISAARFALANHDRDLSLARIFDDANVPPPGAVLERLVDLEMELDDLRRDGNAIYSISRHIELLAAIMAESRTLSLVA